MIHTRSPVLVSEDLRVQPGPLLLHGAGDGPGLAAHRARWGQVPHVDVDALGDLARGAGLRGRGGAGFPFATKLAAVAGGRRGFVVVNAAEGEPASAKDAALLTTAPHLVLDGAAAAARALGLREVHVVLPGDRARARAAMSTAIRERDDRRLRWRTRTAAPQFVSGQSRAVVELLEGRPNLPVTAWEPEAVRGVHGRPTLLSNAETWAHLGALVLAGLPAYIRFGTDAEPGTTLLTVTTPGRQPHVHEVEHGSPVVDVLPVRARGGPVLMGGFHGAWVRWDVLAGAPVSRSGLAELGVPLGAGVVHAPAPGSCPLGLTSQIVAHLASQSAGRCGPCFLGLPALADAVAALLEGRPGARDRAASLTGMVAGRGACAHPDGTVRLVRSLLTTLADEVGAHAMGSCIARQRLALGEERAS